MVISRIVAIITAKKAELEERLESEQREKEDKEAEAIELLENHIGAAKPGAVADAVNDLRSVDFFDSDGNQNTAEIATCLRRLCILASPANVAQFYESDVCTVVALQMRLHIGQVLAIVEAYTEVSKKTKTSKIRNPPPPMDNGVALYGCGLFDRLIPIDRAGRMKAKLLEKSVDVVSILRTIRKYYPYSSGSFRYATLALKKLTPSMPPTFQVVENENDI